MDNTIASDVNIVLQADDIKLLRTLILTGDTEELMKSRCKDNCSVNSALISSQNVKTCPLHMAVDVPVDSYRQDVVKFLLSVGADCNIVDGRGYSPLHHAVVRRNIVAVKDLLDVRSDINLQVEPPFPSFKGAYCGYARGRMMDRWTELKSFPLHLAVIDSSQEAPLFQAAVYRQIGNVTNTSQRSQQEYDLIKVLLDHGANCKLLDGRGLSSLHYAVSQNDQTVAAILLDAGANINAQSREQHLTPLFFATDESMVKFLILREADPEIPAWNSNSLLHIFIYNGLSDVTRYIVSDMVTLLERKNDQHHSPLAAALSIKNTKAAMLLMRAGCDPHPEVSKVNDRTSWIYTPEGDELLNAMKETASNPRQLVDLCTFRIRNIIKRNINTAADSLPLPSKLKHRIRLTDII